MTSTSATTKTWHHPEGESSHFTGQEALTDIDGPVCFGTADDQPPSEAGPPMSTVDLTRARGSEDQHPRPRMSEDNMDTQGYNLESSPGLTSQEPNFSRATLCQVSTSSNRITPAVMASEQVTPVAQIVRGPFTPQRSPRWATPIKSAISNHPGASKQGSPERASTHEDVYFKTVAFDDPVSPKQSSWESQATPEQTITKYVADEQSPPAQPNHHNQEVLPNQTVSPKSQTSSDGSEGTHRSQSTNSSSVKPPSQAPSPKQSSAEQSSPGPVNIQEQISSKKWHEEAYKDSEAVDLDGPDELDTVSQSSTSASVSSFPSPLDPAPKHYLRKDCCSTYCACPGRWSSFPSGPDEEAALASASLPLVLRHKPNNTLRTGWETCEIVARDAGMKDALTKLFDGYPGFDARLMGDGDWVFKAPFTPFLHCWDRISAYRPSWVDHVDQPKWQHIYDSLASVLDSSLKELERIKEMGEAKFDDLWLIYAPGTVVVTEVPPHGTRNLRVPSAARVLTCKPVSGGGSAMAETQLWQVESQVFESDGVHSGWSVESWEIPRFEGYRRVNKLNPFYPLDFHPDPFSLANELHPRGERAARYKAGVHCLEFDGSKPVAVMDQDGEWRLGPSVTCTVVVDVDGYYNHCKAMIRPQIPRKFASDYGKVAESESESESESEFIHLAQGRLPDCVREDIPYRSMEEDTACAFRDCGCDDRAHLYYSDKKDCEFGRDHPHARDLVSYDDEEPDSFSPFASTRQDPTVGEPVTWAAPFKGRLKAKHLLARGYLGAFDLQTKQWHRFPADALREPNWDECALDALYPSAHPVVERVHELVRRKLDSSRALEVDGTALSRTGIRSYTGRALTFLFAGPHGVGKTATVHAIASMCRTSVYTTTPDELCNSPGGFQKALRAALDMCQRFKCLLLLEDAGNLTRPDARCKDHVSMVLQCISQYQSIMFMTAASAETIPDSLLGRVDQIVSFGELDDEARRRIWKKQLEEQGLLRTINANKLETLLMNLERHRLNGHEIANMAKMAPMQCGGGGYAEDEDLYIIALTKLVQDRAPLEEKYPRGKQCEREREVVMAKKTRESL